MTDIVSAAAAGINAGGSTANGPLLSNISQSVSHGEILISILLLIIIFSYIGFLTGRAYEVLRFRDYAYKKTL